MSSKARYLCLTSQPRVICLDPTGRLTGSVSWSSHSQVIATQMTDHKFTLCHVHKSDSHGAMGDSHQQEQLDTIALFSQKTVFQRLFMQNKSTVKNQRNCPKSSSDNSHNTDSSQRHAISSDEVEPYISIQYQFLDSVYGSEVWVRAIQDINSAWERRYMPCIVSSI